MKKQTQNKQNSTPYTTYLSNWRYCGEIADVEKSLTRQFMTDLFDKNKNECNKSNIILCCSTLNSCRYEYVKRNLRDNRGIKYSKWKFCNIRKTIKI